MHDLTLAPLRVMRGSTLTLSHRRLLSESRGILKRSCLLFSVMSTYCFCFLVFAFPISLGFPAASTAPPPNCHHSHHLAEAPSPKGRWDFLGWFRCFFPGRVSEPQFWLCRSQFQALCTGNTANPSLTVPDSACKAAIPTNLHERTMWNAPSPCNFTREP